MSQKAIFFDFDGTIVDNIDEIFKGVCNVFVQSGLPAPTFLDFYSNYQIPYMKFYRERGVTESDEVMVRWFNDVSKHQERPFFPHVAEDMETLKAEGYTLSIISSNYLDVVCRKCDKEHVTQYLSAIIGRTTEMLVDYKSAHIEACCSDFKIEKKNTLYVGDFISDMRDARRVPVTPVGFTGKKGTAEILIQHGAQFCISTLSELTSALKN